MFAAVWADEHHELAMIWIDSEDLEASLTQPPGKMRPARRLGRPDGPGCLRGRPRGIRVRPGSSSGDPRLNACPFLIKHYNMPIWHPTNSGYQLPWTS